MVKVSCILHYKCVFFSKIQLIIKIITCCVPFKCFIRYNMSKYDAVNFVGDNEAINQVQIGSSKTSNRGAFLGSFAALHSIMMSVSPNNVPQYELYSIQYSSRYVHCFISGS